MKAALILVKSYSTLNVQLEFCDSKTYTEEKAYWLLPGYHSVEYKEVCEIDFSAAKTLKKNLDAKVVNYTNIVN